VGILGGCAGSMALDYMYQLCGGLCISVVSLGDTSMSWQGFFEVGGGLGFAVGPPIGGLLYAVEWLP